MSFALNYRVLIVLIYLFEIFGELRLSELPKFSSNVWSLATLNVDQTSTNMNIITYATAVGIKPERVWTLSLYKGTLTHENFMRTGHGALQLLKRSHAQLVPVLGKLTGLSDQKQSFLRRLKSDTLPLARIEGYADSTNMDNPLMLDVLKDCGAVLVLKKLPEVVDVGDHDVVFCKVISSFVGDYETNDLLTTDFLRSKGLLPP